MSDLSKFGYFDAPGQIEPAYDPGLDIDCPFCHRILRGGDVRFQSLMCMEDSRSYFYAYHWPCRQTASEADVEAVEAPLYERIESKVQ